MRKSIAALLFMFLVPQTALAEKVWCPERGHSYPRTGAMVWTINSDFGARLDLLTTGIGSSHAQEIKNLNTNTKILFMVDWNVAAHFGSSIPEDFRLRTANGDFFTIYPQPNALSVNFSDMCPEINGQQGWGWFAEEIVEVRDLDIFDGLATDGLYGGGSMEVIAHSAGGGGLDLDHDGNPETPDEVKTHWNNGVASMLSRIRELIGEDKLLVINAGTAFGDHPRRSAINGAIIEYFLDAADPPDWNLSQYFGFNPASPHASLFPSNFNWINSFAESPAKDNFFIVRFGLTQVLLGDGYYGFTCTRIPEHWHVRWYDEFEVDLGYPTTDAMQVGDRHVWVRFFDKGVNITNITGAPATVTDAELQELEGYDGPYFRFLGGQDPEFNDGSAFYEIELFGGIYVHSGNIHERAGDGIILLKTPEIVVSDIIVDNDDISTSAGSEIPEFIGTWTTIFKYNDNYAVNNVHDTNVGVIKAIDRGDDINMFSGYSITTAQNAMAVYQPNIGVAGNYRVYEWHGHHDGEEASNVRYTVNYEGGSEEFVVDQKANQGQWNTLGTYYFDVGTTGNVTISAEEADGVVIADAIKWEYMHSCTPNETKYCITPELCPGEATCLTDETWGECEAKPLDHEICGNGLDDDCNGIIDDPEICDIPEPGCDLEILITADDSYELYINGEQVGEDDWWLSAEHFEEFLGPGEHVIAISAYNTPDIESEDNPAGVLADVRLCGEDISTSGQWGASKVEEEGWLTSPDIEWPAATVVAEYGEGVWGQYNNGVVNGMVDDTSAKWIWVDETMGDQYAYFRLVVTVESDPPVFNWIRPNEQEHISDDGSFLLVWETAAGTDPNAEISLYYGTAQGEGNGTLINTEGPISVADGATEYLWDTSELPEGIYYIYAEVSDSNYRLVIEAPVAVEVRAGRDTSGGCSCSSSGDPGSGTLLWLALLLIVWAMRKKRILGLLEKGEDSSPPSPM